MAPWSPPTLTEMKGDSDSEEEEEILEEEEDFDGVEEEESEYSSSSSLEEDEYEDLMAKAGASSSSAPRRRRSKRLQDLEDRFRSVAGEEGGAGSGVQRITAEGQGEEDDDVAVAPDDERRVGNGEEEEVEEEEEEEDDFAEHVQVLLNALMSRYFGISLHSSFFQGYTEFANCAYAMEQDIRRHPEFRAMPKKSRHFFRDKIVGSFAFLFPLFEGGRQK